LATEWGFQFRESGGGFDLGLSIRSIDWLSRLSQSPSRLPHHNSSFPHSHLSTSPNASTDTYGPMLPPLPINMEGDAAQLGPDGVRRAQHQSTRKSILSLNHPIPAYHL